MKKIQTHNQVLEVPSTVREDVEEASRVATRSWRLLVESLEMFQRAEVVFAERTELAKKRQGVSMLTVEVGIDLQSDPVWRESIASADYALKRMTAMAAATEAARSRLADLQYKFPEWSHL